MKRFKIKNNKNGLEFIQQGADVKMQPEYGLPERWVSGDKISDEEKATALETREISDMSGNLVYEYRLPAEYSIVEEDMTAEIAAAEADKLDREEARQFLKGLKKADLKTTADCAAAIMKIVKHLRADK